LLVFEEEGFVTSVEIDGLELACAIRANGAHEAQGVGDGCYDVGVLGLELRVLHVTKTPVEGAMEIGYTRG
jgi:hypothetical protein